MVNVRKFEFDLSFDAPYGRQVPQPVAAPEPEPVFEDHPEEETPAIPPEPVFCLTELEDARKTAWDAGFAMGEQAALARIEQHQAEATAHLILALDQAASAQRRAIDLIESQATHLAQHVIMRLFPALTARVGIGEITHMVRDIFAEAIQEPRLVIRVAPDEMAVVDGIVETSAKQSGFDGKFLLLSDQTLHPGDCRIDWGEGGVERAPRQILAALDAAIARNLAHFDETHGATPMRDPGQSSMRDD